MKNKTKIICALFAAVMSLFVLCSCTFLYYPRFKGWTSGEIEYKGVTYVDAHRTALDIGKYYDFPYEASPGFSGKTIGYITGSTANTYQIKYLSEDILVEQSWYHLYLWLKPGYSFSAIEDYTIKNIVSVEIGRQNSWAPDLIINKIIDFSDKPVNYFDIVEKEDFIEIGNTGGGGSREIRLYINEIKDITLALTVIKQGEKLYLQYYEHKGANTFYKTGYYAIKEQYTKLIENGFIEPFDY